MCFFDWHLQDMSLQLPPDLSGFCFIRLLLLLQFRSMAMEFVLLPSPSLANGIAEECMFASRASPSSTSGGLTIGTWVSGTHVFDQRPEMMGKC
jgi:hypothetical protein